MRVLSLAFPALLASGCAHTRATDQLLAAYGAAQLRAVVAEEQAADLGRQVRHLEEILRERGLIESSDNPLETATQLARDLEGQVVDLGRRVDASEAKQDKAYTNQLAQARWLEARLAQVEGLLGVEPPAIGAEGAPGVASGGVRTDNVLSSPLSLQERIQRAEAARAAGQPAVALAHVALAARGLEPDAPHLVWLRLVEGETLGDLGRCTEALPKLRAVATPNRPGAEPLPAVPTYQARALFAAAVCLERDGKKGNARVFFQEIVTQYPQTPTAQAAREAIARLDATPAATP
ncbi:MAG: hypothetical protein RLZZ383_385 [Pseudomonadota bacterium]|jgi:TolA-binding protein